MIDKDEILSFNVSITDPTKIWDNIPLKLIGSLTLNRNPENYFSEVD